MSVHSASSFALLVGLVVLGTSQGQPPAEKAVPPAVPPMETTPAPVENWPKEISGKDLKGWLAELKDSPDGSLREFAVKAIPQFGPPARDQSLAPLLAALRKETDPGVKINILIVLGNYGPKTAEEGKKIVEPLKLLITNSPPGSPYRLHAVRGLANCADYAAEAIPELSKALEDTAWETRRTAASAIALIGKPNPKRKSPLKNALDTVKDRVKAEKSVPVRLELVQSLVVMGPPAFSTPAEYEKIIGPYYTTVTDLQKSEQDKAIQVWLYVLLMLYDGNQLKESTVGKIADYLPKDDAGGRIAALRALALLGDHSKPFLAHIGNALNHQDQFTVSEALVSLGALGVTAKPLLPELEKFKTTTKDEVLKDMAVQAIDLINGRKPQPPAAPAPAPAPPAKK
jgi:hypothetical protein